ncbi:MAG: hypothetical protein NW208_19260 [Bryobacter sp.]|nr:hypothetical protein [Bryobacter sp.]
MRTTLDIDDDVLAAAKELARLKQQGLGRTISDLARQSLTNESLTSQATPVKQVEFGVPVWKHGPSALPVTSELVHALAEEE